MTICHICSRQGRGFGFTPRNTTINVNACSMSCLKKISNHYRETGKLIDPTQHEVNAILCASNHAGQYLEELGKTDLAMMTAEEWSTFLTIVISGYVEYLRDEAPF